MKGATTIAPDAGGIVVAVVDGSQKIPGIYFWGLAGGIIFGYNPET
jgi:hypothetical protein